MIRAAVVSSLRVSRIRPAGSRGVSVASPRTCGMTATPVSKPDMPSASLGKTSSATPTIASGEECWAVIASHQLPITTGCASTCQAEVAEDHHVECQVGCRRADGDADRLAEALEEHRAQGGEQHQRDPQVRAVQQRRGEGVLHDVRGGVGGRQGHGDHEVGGGEAQQHQHQELPGPPGQQPLQHGDRALAVRALLGDPAVDGQRAEEGQRDQHEGGERREQPGRQRGDARLVAEGGEVVDAGQAHDPPPGVALVLGRRRAVRAGVAGGLARSVRPAASPATVGRQACGGRDPPGCRSYGNVLPIVVCARCWSGDGGNRAGGHRGNTW